MGKSIETTKQVVMENLLEDIGGYGKFQKIFTFLAMFPQLASAMIIFSPVFTGRNKVPLYCDDPSEFYETYTCGVNCTNSTGHHNYVSVVQEWNLVCSRSWVADTITSLQMTGMMVGAFGSSLIAERFGRKVGYLSVTLAMATFGMIPALMTSPEMYAFSRFLAGVGDGGTFVVYLVHLTEFLTPSWRSLCGTIPFWCFGEMLLGLLAYSIPNWRLLTVATAAPVLAVFLFYPYIQESPRWLLTRNRTDDAMQVLTKIAHWNSKPAPERATIEALQRTVIQEDAKAVKGLRGLGQLWRSKTLRLHLAILSWVKMACALTYYGLSFSAKSLSGSPYLNIVYMALLDLVATVLIPFVCNRLGRNRSIIVSMAFAAIFLVIALILSVLSAAFSTTASVVVTVSVLLGRFGVAFCFGSLRLVTLELFPTTLRSSALGFTTLACYLAGILAPQGAFLARISPAIPYGIYVFLTVSSSLCSLMLQEMTGEPLNDVVQGKK